MIIDRRFRGNGSQSDRRGSKWACASARRQQIALAERRISSQESTSLNQHFALASTWLMVYFSSCPSQTVLLWMILMPVPLHVHSWYSLLEGVTSPAALL